MTTEWQQERLNWKDTETRTRIEETNLTGKVGQFEEVLGRVYNVKEIREDWGGGFIWIRSEEDPRVSWVMSNFPGNIISNNVKSFY